MLTHYSVILFVFLPNITLDYVGSAARIKPAKFSAIHTHSTNRTKRILEFNLESTINQNIPTNNSA